MKYFLTGITGFIGSNLARQLATDGHTVHAIIRKDIPEDLKTLQNIRFFKGDLHDLMALKESMAGCEAAFHLAAYAKPWAKDRSDFYRYNVEGAENVFSTALESGVKKVVFTSSAATMSPSVNHEPVHEGTARNIPYFNVYEVTKAEAEKKARHYSDLGLPVTIVNPSRVYGPGPINASNAVTRMIDGYQRRTWRIIPGDGKKIGNYVFIDDVVYGHELAMQKGKAGERYILGGDNITFNELFQILEGLVGMKRKMFHLPIGLMLAAAKGMEWQSPLTGVPPAITADFVKKYMNNWSLSSEKAIKELGYRVTSFETGAMKTIEWLINTRQDKNK